MWRKLLLAGVLALLLLPSAKVSATHVMGSDIVYRCLGGGQYEVLVRVYRDCNGISISQSDLEATCGANRVTVSAQTLVSVRDITGISPACNITSACAGGSYAYGVEEYVFSMILDLSAYSCCNWTLSWEQCCRNNSISTGMAGENFYTTATLNKCLASCNSSPDFTNPPVAIICSNQDFVFNNGAVDTIDAGDSLSYALVPALQGAGTSVTYSGSYSGGRPLRFLGWPNQNAPWPSGFHLDPVTGDVAFRPTLTNQIAVVVIEVTEWRRVGGVMTAIGTTRRDMQVLVVNCATNQAPTLNGPFSFQACANRQICVPISSNDANAADTVQISWNRGIAGATFTHNNGAARLASGQVCWTPEDSDVSPNPYIFTVTARDNACPLSGQSIVAYSIYVNESPSTQLNMAVLPCGNVRFDHTTIPSSGISNTWTVFDSTGAQVWMSNNQLDSAQFSPGNYTVQLITSTPNCDTTINSAFIVPDYLTNQVNNDTVVCENSVVSLTANDQFGLGPMLYQWTSQNYPLGSGSDRQTINLIPPGTDTYIAQVTDANGCVAYDTVVVTVSPLPALDLGADQIICTGTSTSLDAGDGSPLSYLWNDASTNRYLVVNDSGTYSVTITDPQGCQNTDDIHIGLNSPEPFITGPDSMCMNDIATYSVTPVAGETYGWFVNGGNIIGPTNGPSIQVLWGSGTLGTVAITQTSALGCDSTFSLNVTIKRKPIPLIQSASDSVCENKITFFNTQPLAGDAVAWFVNGGNILGSNTDTFIQVLWSTPGNGLVSVTHSTPLGCDSTVDLPITILPTPVPVINVPNDTTCENKITTYSVTPVAGETYNWSVNGGAIIGANTGSSINVLWAGPGTGTVSVTQSSAFGCDSTVSEDVLIIQTPKPVISIPNDTTCENKIATYSITPVAGETYNWTVNGGAIIGSNTAASIDVLWGTPGTGTVTVTQTSSFGCDSTVSSDILIIPTPKPVINVPNDTTCENKITTYSVTPVAGETYNWSVNGGAIIGANTAASIDVLWAGPGTGTVTVTQTSPFGCDSTVSENVLIIQTPKPVIAIPNDTTCENKIATYSITPVAGETYNWTVNGGSIIGSNTTSSINVLWGTPGTGTVTVTQTSSFGCDSTVSSDILIIQTPKPVINVPNDTTCENKITTYSVTPVAGETYNWSVNGGAIIGANDGTSIDVLWAGPGTGTVTVTQTSPFGCDSTVSENVLIIQTPKPVIAIANDTTCENKIATYSITPVAGETYNWTVNGGAIIGSNTAASIDVLWGTPGTGTVTVTQTSSFGCDSTVSSDILIIQTPKPVINVPNDTTCENKITTYSVTPVAGETYNWTVNGGAIIGANDGTSIDVLWAGPGTGTVTVTQTSPFGCDSTVSEDVLIIQTPKPVISIPNDTTCENKIATYSITPVAGETYNWTVNGGAIIGSNTAASIDVLWGTPGTGTVTVTQTSSFGCDSTVSSDILIIQTPKPVINVPNDTTCENKITTYSVTPVAGETYNWSVNGGAIIGSNAGSSINVLWAGPGTGTVTVTQTSPFGCDSTVSENVLIIQTPKPVIAIANDTTCENKIATYSITPVAGETYNWTVNGGSIIGSNTAASIDVLWGTAGTGTVSVTQTSSFGCDSTVSSDILIIQTPKPVINVPNDTTCENKITTYSVTPVAGETYNWTVNGGTIIGSNTAASIDVLWAGPGTGTVTVTQTSSFGCDSTVSEDVLIIQTPKPVIAIANDTTCENKIATYSITPVAGETYNWTVNGGSIIGSNTAASIDVLWGTPGTGTVTVTQTSSFGCDSTVSSDILIIQTPKPVINVPNDTTCENKITTYSVTPVAGETYNWSVNGGAIIGSNTASSIDVLWAGPGTGTVTVTQTSPFGCDSTVSENVLIIQTPKPVIAIANDTTCENKIATYSITPVAGETYNWSVNGGAIIGSNTAASIDVLWGTPGTGTVTVTQTSSFGCDSTVSSDILIIQTPKPVINVPNDTTCENKITTYSVTPVAGETYNWTVNGGAIIGANDGTSIDVLWAGPGTGTVTVTQTSPFGCDSTVSENVLIIQTPKPVIAIANDTTCENKIATYSITPVAGETYNWTVNGGSIIGSNTAASIDVLWAGPGTGTVTVTQTSSFGCDSTVSSDILIIQTPKPVINVPNDTTCENKIATYSITPVAGETYNWSVNGGAIIGANDGTSIDVLWAGPGTGTVTVTQTSPFGCDSTVSEDVLIIQTPKPVIAIANDTTCENKIATYSITAVAGETYNWSVNGGAIIGSNTTASIDVLWAGPGTGTVTVTQTSSFGCDSTVSSDILIIQTPKPVINVPNDTTCENKITTYSVTPVAGETYNWTVNGGAIIGSNTASSINVLWAGPGTGTVTVTQTSPFGCDSTVSEDVLIIQTPKPVIAIANDTTCENKIATYSITPVVGETYNWTVNGGSIIGSNTTSSIDVLWGAPGTGTVTVTQTSSFGCDSTVSSDILIIQTPKPVIDVPNDTTCENKITTYSVTPVAGETYNWTVNGGAIIGSNTASSIDVLWAGPGTGTVTVTQTSSFGCDSTVSEDVLIIQTPKPVISIPNDTTCENKIATYSITPVTGETYNWSVNGGAIIGANDGTSIDVLWAGPGTGTVTVTQTSSFGCDSTVSSDILIIQTPKPVINVPNDTTCENKITTYSVTPVAGETYNWSVNGGAIIGANDGTSIDVLWAGPGTGTVTVTQTSPFGCDSTVSEDVLIIQTPKPVIAIANDTTCENKIATYSITPVAGETYNWTVNGGSIIGSNTTSSIDVLWGTPGTGTVTVTQTSSFGCDSTVSSDILIIQTPKPVINVPNDTTCENKITTYSVTPVAGETYNWTVNGGAIIGANDGTSIDVLWAGPGTGTVTVTQTSPFGCDSTVSENVLIIQTPKPVISIPNDTTCENKIATYSITPVAGETYNWTVNGGAIIGSNTTSSIDVLWGTPGTGTVTVTQTSSFGCDSTVSSDILIIQTPKPVINVPNDTTCENKITTYSVTPVAGETYNWSVNGGAIIGANDGTSIDVLWAGPGTGTVTVTQTSPFGCDSTVSEDVLIIQTPKPVISIPNDTTCENKIATYSITPVAGETYNWSVNGGSIIGSNTTSSIDVLWGTPGTGTVTVTQTSSFGCDSTVSSDILIIQTPKPVINVPNDTTCENKITTYSVTPVAGETYNWTVNGGAIIGSNTAASIDVLWAGPGVGTVTVTQSSGFGCDSTVSEDVLIIQTPKPVIAIANDTTCENKIATYSITPVAGETYNWSVNGGAILGSNTAASIDVLWGTPGTGTVTVTQTSSFGCDSTVSSDILIIQTPKPVINVPNDTTCENKITTYSVTPVAGETYNWSVNGGAIIGSNTAASIDVLWAGPGTGTVTVTQTSSFGCDSTVSEDVFIIQTPKPVIAIPNDTTCENKIATYSITPVAGETYNWSVNGGAILGANNGTSIDVLWGAPGTGTVSLTQTSPFGCDSTVTADITIVYTPKPAILAPNDSVCHNNIYIYYIQPQGPGESYQWTVSGGTIIGSTTDTFLNVLWGNPGTGSIGVQVISAWGCDSAITETVYKVLTPSPIISGVDSTCENKIYAYSTPYTAGHNYTWTVSGGTFVSASDSNVVYIMWNGPGTGAISVLEAAPFSCDSLVTDTIQILPTPKPVINVPNDTTCESKITTYSVTPVAGETYNWSVNGGAIVGSNTGSSIDVLWAGPGTGTVSVTQSSAFGCDSTVSEDVLIIQTPKPVIAIANDTTCENKIATYSITPVAGETYSWSVNGGSIIGSNTAASIDVLWAGPGTGTVSVTQTSSFGCDSTVSSDILIIQTPKPVINVPNDTTCENKITTYSVTPVAGETYNWSVNGGAIIGSNTAASIDVLWAGPGVGTVTVTQTSSFGCDSTVSEDVLIIQTPKPVISIPNDTTCENKIATYSITPVAGETYNWSVNGGAIIGSNTTASIDVLWGTPGTGTVTVTQTSSFGCDSTVSSDILIIQTPKPVINVPNDTTCENKITTYSVTPVAGETYNWSVNGGAIVGSNTAASIDVLWAGPGTGTVTVTQTSPFGCDSTVSEDVLIIQTPKPVISIPNDTTCENKIATYSITPVAGETYNWSVNGGSIIGSNTAASIDVLWGTPGTGTVTVTQTSSFGCDSTVSSDILIIQTPKPVINVPNDTTCENKITTYSVTPVAGETYNWTVNGGAIIGSNTAASIDVLWAGPGTGTVTVTQTSSFGCDSTVSEDVLIIQTPKPVISIPNDTTCENKIATYSITPVAGETYNWSVNGGAIIGANDGTSIDVLWAGPGTGTVSVTQTSSFGCDSTVSSDILIIQTPKPVINVPNDTTCENKITTYSVTPVAGETYNWSVNGGAIIGANDGTSIDVLWAGPGTGTVTVTQTSSFGCDSTVSEDVLIIQTPKPVISIPNDTTCENKIATYSITPVAGETYNWSVNGGSIIGSNTAASIDVLWGTPGTGTVTVTQTSGFGCDSTVSSDILIIQTPKPVINVPNDTTCENKITTYSVTPVAGETYNWSVNGGAIIGENDGTSIDVLWAGPGTGTVTVTQTSPFGCDSTVSEDVLIIQTPKPVIAIANDTTCENKIATYSITPVAGETYNWSVNGGAIIGSNTAASIDVLWGTPGTGTVTVTQTSSFGCDSTVSSDILIIQTPKPVINVPNDTTCENKITTYSVTPVAGETYNWSVNGGAIIGANDGTSIDVLWAGPGTGTVTVTQTSPFGCDSTVSEDVLIIQTPKPVIAIANDTTCENKIATYSITPVVGETYNWTVNGGAIIGSNTAASIDVLWGTPGTGTVTVTQTSSFGCDSTVSSDILIIKTPKPVINVPNDTTCENKITTYSVTPVAGETYNWTVNGGAIIGSNTASSIDVLWAGPGVGTVTVTQSSGFGCDSTVSEDVLIIQTPKPVISIPNDTTCENKIATYSITPVAGETYNWSVNGGAILGSNTAASIDVLWGTPGTGTVTVTQTSSFGCDSTVSSDILIIQTPKPVINVPNDTTCENKITTYSVTPVAGETYNWTVNGGAIIGSNTAASIDVLWAGPGTGTVTVTQTSPFGCDSTVSEDVLIIQTPKPVISIPNDTTCENKIATYSITPVAGETYNWTVNGGAIIGSNTAASIDVLWAGPGTGTVTVTQTSNFGCDSTVSSDILIIQTPKPVINVPNDTTCENKITTYSVTPVAGETYNWSVNGGAIIGANDGTSIDVLWAGPGTGTVTVTQTSPFGCDSTVSEDVLIIQTPKPVIAIANDTTCENKIATYSITPVAGETYNWTVNGGSIIGSNTASSIDVLWGTPGTGTVTVTQTSPFGCDSTVSSDILIIQTPKPVINVPNDTTCENKFATYSVTPVAGETYSWSVNGGAIIGVNDGTSIDVLWAGPGTGTVTVTQTSSFGCDSTVSEDVLIIQTPKPVINVPNDTTCENKITTYSVTPVAGETYNWSVNGGVIIGSNTASSIDVLWAGPGTGTVTVTQTSSFGCDSTVSEDVLIIQTPKPVIAIANDTTCENKIATYSITPVAGETYNWTVNGGTILGSNTAASIDVMWGMPGTGTVTVTQTSSFGCDSTVSSDILIVPTPKPVINGDLNPCRDKVFTYMALTPNVQSYTWTLTGGHIVGPDNLQTVNVIWDTLGLAEITVLTVSDFGCDSTVTQNIQVRPTPRVSISGPDTLCQNEVGMYHVEFDNTWSYSWSISGGQIIGASNKDTLYVLWTQPNNNNINITVANQAGCDTVILDFPTYIKDKPTPVISGPNSVCRHEVAFYRAQGAGGMDVEWTANGGTILGDIHADSVEVYWDSSASNELILRFTNQQGCDSTVTESIQVNPKPKPVVSGPQKVCENKYITYTVGLNPGSGSGTFTYNWQVLGGSIIGSSTGNSILVKWDQTGAALLSLQVQSNYACDSTINLPVLVQPATVPFINGQDSACHNKIVSYSAPAHANHSYSWTIQNGVILSGSTTNQINVMWTGSGSGRLRLVLVNANGCDSSVEKAVIIKPTPTPAIAGPAYVCVNGLESYSTLGSPGLSYRWEVTGGSIVGPDNLNMVLIQWSDTGSGKVRITATNALGCDSSVVRNITISPNPVASIEGSSVACANSVGNPYYLKDYGVHGGSSFMYEWSTIGGQIVRGSNEDTVTINWGSSGTYPVVLKVTNILTNCFSIDTFYVSVGVIQEPVIAAEDFSGCVPFSLTLNEQSGLDSVEYSWSVIGQSNMQSSDASPTFTFYKADLYQVQLIVKNPHGCVDTAYMTVDAGQSVFADFVILSEDSVFLGDQTQFINQTRGANEYEWIFHDGDYSYDVHANKLYEEPGKYPVTLKAWNDKGCRDSITKYVWVKVIPELYIPNAFTPNDDIHNQYFTVYTYYIVEMEFIIMDRWGEIVYRCNDLNVKWDGTYKGEPAPEGVYGYYLQAVDYNHKIIVKKGNITLLR